MLRLGDFISEAEFQFGTYGIKADDLPWEIVAKIPELCDILIGSKRRVNGRVDRLAHVADGPMYIDAQATVEPGAVIMASSYIGPGVTIRGGAYVRENCIFLDGSLLGHASEAKNSLLFSGAKAPHFAYVGDSALGAEVNLGAGTKLSNVRARNSRAEVTVSYEGQKRSTGMRKLGAIIGDGVQVGCNAVLNPGTLIGKGAIVYPGAVVTGYVAERSILKLRQEHDVDIILD